MEGCSVSIAHLWVMNRRWSESPVVNVHTSGIVFVRSTDYKIWKIRKEEQKKTNYCLIKTGSKFFILIFIFDLFSRLEELRREFTLSLPKKSSTVFCCKSFRLKAFDGCHDGITIQWHRGVHPTVENLHSRESNRRESNYRTDETTIEERVYFLNSFPANCSLVGGSDHASCYFRWHK